MVGSVNSKWIIERQRAQFQAERVRLQAHLERQQRPITVDQVKELLEIARQVLERFEKMEVAHMEEFSTRQEFLIAKQHEQSERMEALVAHMEEFSTRQELLIARQHEQSERMEELVAHNFMEEESTSSRTNASRALGRARLRSSGVWSDQESDTD